MILLYVSFMSAYVSNTNNWTANSCESGSGFLFEFLTQQIKGPIDARLCRVMEISEPEAFVNSSCQMDATHSPACAAPTGTAAYRVV